jgi:tetratricopeptide (TPR) repeat protein
MIFRLRRHTERVLVFWLLISALCVCVAVGGTARPEGAANHLEMGVALLQAGDIQAAREEFQAAIRQNPQSFEAYVYMGIAENQLRHFADAAPVLREALRLDPDSEAAHYNIALSLLGLHKTNEAIREFQTVVKLNPRNGSANYNLGLLLAEEGNLKKACEYLESARSTQPGDPAVWIHLVDLYLRIGNDVDALELVREGTKLDSSGKLSMQLGELLVEKDRFKEAVPVLEQARSLRPDTPAITGYLARAYLEAGQPAKVIELLAPIRDEKASWEVYYLRGLAFTSTDRREEAARAFLKALLIRPDEASIHYGFGKLLLESDNPKGRQAGVDEINRATQLSPRKSEYYFTLASYYFDSRKLKATIELLKSAVELVPPSVQMYVTLGLAELELEGPVQAKPFIMKAIALDPQAGAGYDLLGRCDMRLGDEANAAQHFMKAAELTPGNDIYFRDAAIALEKLGRPAGGLPFAEKSVKLRPDQLYNHYILGKLYSQTGHRTDAIRELESCVQLNPKNYLPYNLLAVLYKHAGEDAKAEVCWRTLKALKQQSVTEEEQRLSRLGSVPQ